MECKYIFFDWGYTLISKFENVDDKINKILEKYNLQWDDIFRKWKSYQILNSLGKITEKEIYEDLSLILNISKEDLEEIDMLLLESHILDEETRNTIIKLHKKGYYLGIISNNSIRNVTIAALLGGGAVAGYMYMKNHPKVMRNIMGMMKDMEKAKLSMLDKPE